jgi:triosephosphate isomerase
MRRPLVAGNWKMNGSAEMAASLARAVAEGAPVAGCDLVLCPPFVYLTAVGAALEGSGVGLGAQNVAATTAGAFTGEVSAEMLADVGCSHVIVGHSERRALFGETDAVVAGKCERVLAAGLTPIVCVGETLEEREHGRTEEVVGGQLEALVTVGGAALIGRSVIAYEPVWAIGTGLTATPEQAQVVHGFLRARVAAHDEAVARGVQILYGGSVKADNAEGLFAMADIDGGLIGGASLDAGGFLAICAATSG